MDRRYREFRAIVAISLLVLLGACGTVESENVKSEGIHADIDVVAEGEGSTYVSARLEVGDDGVLRTTLKMTSGDRLMAYAGGVAQQMSRSKSLLYGTSYVTTFPFAGGGTEFKVSLEREDFTDARNSKVILPAAFTITTTPDKTYSDLDDPVKTRWEPRRDDRMKIRYALECVDANGFLHIGKYTRSISDRGKHVMTVAEILAQARRNVYDYSNGCSLTITVMRIRSGKIDRNYGEGGRISALQQRRISATIAPP